MRVLIFSDLHANWEALLWMQRAEPEPDAILFLGDAVGYGPDPGPCIQWLQANATAAVQGNHDYGLANNTCGGTMLELHDLAIATLAYAWKVVPAIHIDYLRQLPQQVTLDLDGVSFHLVHGTPVEPLYAKLNLLFTKQDILHRIFDSVDADVVLMGNTHVPAIRKIDGKLLVNPGSLGQPRYGVPDPTYAIWEDGEVQIKHLHISHRETVKKLGLLPLEVNTIQQLQQVLETGQLTLPPGMTLEEMKRKHEAEHGIIWDN
ncbi:MAG: metallophosphoesterase family protein [Chloroflexota bacterium]